MPQLVLFTKEEFTLSVAWLARITPPGTKVREIPLPGFMLNDADERSSISVRVFDPKRRKTALDSIRRLRWHRPPKNVIEELDSRSVAIEVDILKDDRAYGLRHPIACALAKALDAIVEHDDILYDRDLVELRDSSRKTRSETDPNSPIDYGSFACVDGELYSGTAEVPWLAPRVDVVIFTEGDRIPNASRKVLEAAVGLPMTTRDALGRFIDAYARRIDPALPADIWSALSSPGLTIPVKSTPRAYFSVTFECVWDPEHGIEILFDREGRPVKIDIQGAI